MTYNKIKINIMTIKQKQLLESYIEKQVRKHLTEISINSIKNLLEKYKQNPSLIKSTNVEILDDRAILSFKKEIDRNYFISLLQNKTIKIPKKYIQTRGNNNDVYIWFE